MKRNCLSLNGGGCRGLIALHVLEHYYQFNYQKIASSWDYISGASTGALITALLSQGYSPTEIKFIYERELPKIFDKGFLRVVRGKSKYGNEYLKGLAHELISDVRLGEVKQKILIPALNSSLDRCKIFKSHDPKDAEYLLVDVIIASASAPTYFPAHKIGGNFYKDGGLFANNPSEILLKECRREEKRLELKFDEVNILSITTGSTKKRLSKSEQKGGILSAEEMINEVLFQQDMEIHDSVNFEHNEIKSINGTYERCESSISHCSGEIDDVSKSNITDMGLDGELSVLQNRNKLYSFYQKTKQW